MSFLSFDDHRSVFQIQSPPVPRPPVPRKPETIFDRHHPYRRSVLPALEPDRQHKTQKTTRGSWTTLDQGQLRGLNIAKQRSQIARVLQEPFSGPEKNFPAKAYSSRMNGRRENKTGSSPAVEGNKAESGPATEWNKGEYKRGWLEHEGLLYQINGVKAKDPSRLEPKDVGPPVEV